MESETYLKVWDIFEIVTDILEIVKYIVDSEGDIWECWGYLGEWEIFERAWKCLERSDRLNKDEYIIKAYEKLNRKYRIDL